MQFFVSPSALQRDLLLAVVLLFGGRAVVT